MSRWWLRYLQFTALLSGGLVMVIEVLGSRVIGPFFGVSLYVWTSLITVTLLALALGYAVGGWLADRGRSADQLYGVLMLAGFATLLIPVARAPVLAACAPLGLRLGSLTATLLLFGPSLFLLGCVSPYLVRLAAQDLARLGRTVGTLYALSTAGSVIGTVLTGFVLIAWLGADDIFRLAAGLLLALAASYFVLVRRRWLALAALAAPLLVGSPGVPTEMRMPDGTTIEQVADAQSFYGRIKIVDYRFGDLHTREMTIDGLVQGGIDVTSGLSIYEYAYLLQYLPVALHPEGRSCLVVGIGAGIVPRWYSQRGIATDAVDIDPEVVEMAREHFAFAIGGEVHLADARAFLAARGKRYDYLIIDVFNGDVTPAHLLSVEALRQIKRRLTDSGILAANFVAEAGGQDAGLLAIVHTLREVFEQVEVAPAFAEQEDDSIGNVVLLAYDGPPRRPQFERLGSTAVHPLAAAGVHAGIQRRITVPVDPDGLLLTDDFNPVDVIDSGLRERVRRGILETTHWKLLLGANDGTVTPRNPAS